MIKFQERLTFYTFTLLLSCCFLSIFIVLFVGKLWYLPALFIIPLYVFIPYLLFGVTTQMLLNQFPKRFNVFYLLVYSVVAFVAVTCFYTLFFETSLKEVTTTPFYYAVAVGAGVIYWFWDSIFLQKPPLS